MDKPSNLPAFGAVDTVGWASGRASDQYKLSGEVLVWLSAYMPCLHMVQLTPLHPKTP